MKLRTFTGSDAALRRHSLRQAVEQGLHPADYSEHDMGTGAGRQAGAAAIARGPLAGDKRLRLARH